MSKIIRSTNAIPKEEKKVEIQLRNLFTEDFEQDDLEHEQAHKQSIAEISAMRDQFLADAQREIDLQKEEFEKYRHKQLEAIEQLKQMWEEEKLILEQQAYDQGFQQGYEEGINKASADMSEALKVANETIESARLNAQKYIEDQEQVILEIAMTSAERIIGSSLERDEELYLSIIKRGLKEAREMKEIKIYVSPLYHKLISDNLDELAEMFPTDVPLLIFVNEDLNDTDSYIETNHGRIVVSIDEQLNELRLKLDEILSSKD